MVSFTGDAKASLAPSGANPGSTPFPIFVKPMTGLTITVHATLSDTIKSVKAMVAEILTQFPVYRQRLVFAGRDMQDDNTLSSYGIKMESTVFVIGRLMVDCTPLQPISWKVQCGEEATAQLATCISASELHKLTLPDPASMPLLVCPPYPAKARGGMTTVKVRALRAILNVINNRIEEYSFVHKYLQTTRKRVMQWLFRLQKRKHRWHITAPSRAITAVAPTSNTIACTIIGSQFAASEFSVGLVCRFCKGRHYALDCPSDAARDNLAYLARTSPSEGGGGIYTALHAARLPINARERVNQSLSSALAAMAEEDERELDDPYR